MLPISGWFIRRAHLAEQKSRCGLAGFLHFEFRHGRWLFVILVFETNISVDSTDVQNSIRSVNEQENGLLPLCEVTNRKEVPTYWPTPTATLSTLALLNWFVPNGCIGRCKTRARFFPVRAKGKVLEAGRLRPRSSSPSPRAPHQPDGSHQPNSQHNLYCC
jgi:hypothetical protein